VDENANINQDANPLDAKLRELSTMLTKQSQLCHERENTMMKRNNRNTTLLRLLLLLLFVRRVDCFVMAPVKLATQHDIATELESSLTNPTGGNKNENFWTKLSDKVQSILPWTKPKEIDEEQEFGLTKAERKELEKDFTGLAKPFPWPIQPFADSLSRTVNRELKQEERKAKPLLNQAVTLMRQDADVRNVLGTPIKHGRVMAQQTQKSIVNGKKTVRIVDRFQVVGSKRTGVATLTADKHAKNHILALRIDVDGVHYDIDV